MEQDMNINTEEMQQRVWTDNARSNRQERPWVWDCSDPAVSVRVTPEEFHHVQLGHKNLSPPISSRIRQLESRAAGFFSWRKLRISPCFSGGVISCRGRESYRAALHSHQYLLPVLIIRLIKSMGGGERGRGGRNVTFWRSGEGEGTANWGRVRVGRGGRSPDWWVEEGEGGGGGVPPDQTGGVAKIKADVRKCKKTRRRL